MNTSESHKNTSYESTLEIYREVLLAHDEYPHNFYPLEHPTHQACGTNPTCGDQISVYVQEEGEQLKQLSFTGQGCAICKASASLMTAHLQGKPTKEAEADAHQILSLLNDPKGALPGNLGELEALMGVRHFPMRVKCATLAWHAFLDALHKEAAGKSCPPKPLT